MSNRFHNKWHRANHHTYKGEDILDSGWDPIASHENPFRGDFVMNCTGGEGTGSLYSEKIYTTHLFSDNDELSVQWPWFSNAITVHSILDVLEYIHAEGGDSGNHGLIVDNKAIVDSLEVGIDRNNKTISQTTIAAGSASEAGLKAYRYTNTGAVTNSLTFAVPPSGWSVNDKVSVVNNTKWPDCVTIASISDNVVTFTTNLPFNTIVEDSDFDAKIAYVISKPDVGNIDIGIGAYADGVSAKALNYAAHAEGLRTLASGIAAHSEGVNTEAKNQSEHAQGQYNKSNKASATFPNAGNTLHSIGIGTDDNARKNAVEVMQDGKVYIKDVGGYDGTNPFGQQNPANDLASVIDNKIDRIISISWSEIKALRDNGNGNLVPGQQYRITDYVTTTTQTDTQSAGHQFDLIVVADSTNKLNEHARAIKHDGDNHFPAGTKFEAWDIWYCLDNDTNRFEWADETNGKGVIYRMIDEFGNDIPYDFKNIKFRRWAITNITSTRLSSDTVDSLKASLVHSESVPNYWYKGTNTTVTGTIFTLDSNTSDYYFTFNNSNTSSDSSLIVGQIIGNKIGNCKNGAMLCLNGIVFFGNSCSNNTFGDNCSYDTFGNSCSNNTFGDNCRYNIFDKSCSSDTFGNSCSYNIFGDNCSYDTFGNSCSNNTFDKPCQYNNFGNNCRYNNFGKSCHYNNFGNECQYNTFGNNCRYNTFGNYCGGSIFGLDESNRQDYFQYIDFESTVENVRLNCTTSRGTAVYCQNITVSKGIKGTFSSPKIIDIPEAGQLNKTTYEAANPQIIILQ